MSDGTIKVVMRSDAACINLRGDPGDAKIVSAIETALGQPLPVKPNTTSRGDHRVYWLGPDEWLITTGIDNRDELLASLDDAVASMHAAVNDVSGGNVVLQLSGPHTRDLFAKGCTLDFHPDVFKVGDCAQSGLGKAAALLGLADDAPTFDVIVRRSFSDYLVKWLQHSGRDYGIEFP